MQASPQPSPTRGEGVRVGVVAIGRNEGERLRRCLQSVCGVADAVVYVDSGSSDGSVEMARRMGVEVVALDLSLPFTAARARNEGFARLMQVLPEAEFVQFVDGDCEVAADWIPRAIERLKRDKQLAIVCGRRRERFPDASLYNRLCDIEWNTPVGEAKECGGDAMMRTAAVREVAGYDPALIAGEEPEMCYRLRQREWRIERLDAEMTLHDANITRFGQWWKRTLRTGHAWGENSWMHRGEPEAFAVRPTRSVMIWGVIVPAILLLSAWPTRGWSLLLFLLYPLQMLRMTISSRRGGMSWSDAAAWGVSCIVAKFPQAIGVLSYHQARASGRRHAIIEYKEGSDTKENEKSSADHLSPCPLPQGERGRWHIALGREMDLDKVAADARAGIAPGHVWCGLREHFDALVHAPSADGVNLWDKLRSKLSSKPHHWATARRLVQACGQDDIIYCTGEDIGIPIAAYARRSTRRPKVVFCAHNLDRPRARIALKFWRIATAVDLWFTFSQYQAEFIQRFLGVPSERIVWVPERTETTFFTPGPQSPDKKRPLIVSVGLEQRDYRTLASACAAMDVDVKISGFSADKRPDGQQFPPEFPANMTAKFYPWDELRQLYRDADVVVVSTFACKYCAGITTYLEALACRRPVIITDTPGMREYAHPPLGCVVVPPGDPAAMRKAIEDLLGGRARAEALAEAGYQEIMSRHRPEDWLKLSIEKMEALQAWTVRDIEPQGVRALTPHPSPLPQGERG